MRLSALKGKLTAPVAVLATLLVCWLLYRAAFALYGLMWFALLLGGTYWVVRPELRSLLGSRGDDRPWLVRFREHRWRPLALPGGYRVPRVAAYGVAALAWYVWL